MAKVDVVTEIEIRRPPPAVFEFAADPDNAPKWYVNITNVEWRTPKPLRVGSQLEFTAAFLGRKLIYTYEVVELVEGRTLVMRTSQGPFPMETTYEFAPAAEGSTRMTLRNRGTPHGFSSLVAPLMVPAMRRANRKDLALLKQLLESR
jgi:uncharacterized protein YndB with AHSA1/START domain